MLFNSLQFLFFFAIVATAYFCTPHKYRWVLLLIASYYFYMSWIPAYAILLVLSTLVTYFAALGIRSSAKRSKKLIFTAVIVFHIGLLVFFKYLTFLGKLAQDLLGIFSVTIQPWTLAWLLPLGISFYTFQKLSYLIDVYNGTVEPERHIGIFALYSCFFPQLVAGPIERAKHLLPQFYEKHVFALQRVSEGLALMLWGFFVKLVIADRLSVIVNTVFADPTGYTGLPLLLASVLFAIQIYCDFSGYTDIAIGCAHVLGFRLIDNFRKPFGSRSIAEFWRRWHISLSSWFQDYVFNPLYLRLSRMKALGRFASKHKHTIAFSIAVIFGDILLGLWHGANWTYVLFGLYHGVCIALYYICRKWWDRMPSLLQIATTFAIVVGGFIFFRANSVRDAFYIVTHIPLLSTNVSGINIGVGWYDLIITLVFVVIFLLIEVFRPQRIIAAIPQKLAWRWSLFIVTIVIILLFGMYENAQFIYFQF